MAVRRQGLKIGDGSGGLLQLGLAWVVGGGVMMVAVRLGQVWDATKKKKKKKKKSNGGSGGWEKGDRERFRMKEWWEVRGKDEKEVRNEF